jgi:hypothetical protein
MYGRESLVWLIVLVKVVGRKRGVSSKRGVLVGWEAEGQAMSTG